MIKIYYRIGCTSSARAISWFENRNMGIQKQKINAITKENLLELLQVSDDGFNSILKSPGRSNSKVKKDLEYMNSLSFNDSIKFLLRHDYLLQTPIIIEGHNQLIGYNEQEIRQFLSKDYRRQQLYL